MPDQQDRSAKPAPFTNEGHELPIGAGGATETTARNLRVIRELRERRGTGGTWTKPIEGALMGV